MDKLRLFFNLIGISFKSQMEHRASFLMLISAYFLSTFIDMGVERGGDHLRDHACGIFYS